MVSEAPSDPSLTTTVHITGGTTIDGPFAEAKELLARFPEAPFGVVQYLILNEGCVAREGASLHRAELTNEAIRLTRLLRAQRPDDGGVADRPDGQAASGHHRWAAERTLSLRYLELKGLVGS